MFMAMFSGFSRQELERPPLLLIKMDTQKTGKSFKTELYILYLVLFAVAGLLLFYNTRK